MIFSHMSNHTIFVCMKYCDTVIIVINTHDTFNSISYTRVKHENLFV